MEERHLNCCVVVCACSCPRAQKPQIYWLFNSERIEAYRVKKGTERTVKSNIVPRKWSETVLSELDSYFFPFLSLYIRVISSRAFNRPLVIFQMSDLLGIRFTQFYLLALSITTLFTLVRPLRWETLMRILIF